MTTATEAAPRSRASGPVPGLRRRAATASPETVATAHSGRSVASLPFLLGIAGLLAGGLLALLVINNTLAAGSFESVRLQADATLLGEQEQALNQQVERLSSPTRLRQAAKDLGLMPAASTAYVDLADGRILGAPLPAGGLYGSMPNVPKQPQPATNPDGSDGAARLSKPDDNGSRALADPSPAAAPDSGDGASVTPPVSAYDRAVVAGDGR